MRFEHGGDNRLIDRCETPPETTFGLFGCRDGGNDHPVGLRDFGGGALPERFGYQLQSRRWINQQLERRREERRSHDERRALRG